MYHIFVHSSVSGHLGSFCVLAIVNCAAVNTGMHVPFPIMVFLECMPNSGITGPRGSFTPSFLRNLHIVLHNGSINLHLHQQCERVSFPPHTLQQLLL